MTHQKMVDGVLIDLTPQEQAERDAAAAAYVPPTEPPALTKEQLMAELTALTAKIQALE
jgi:hypothetical protein